MKKGQKEETNIEKIKINELNQKINDAFYNDNDFLDSNLYNLGDSTPIVLEDNE